MRRVLCAADATDGLLGDIEGGRAAEGDGAKKRSGLVEIKEVRGERVEAEASKSKPSTQCAGGKADTVPTDSLWSVLGVGLGGTCSWD